jgi:hypothetical protein
MLNLQGDLKEKEQEALHAIPPRRLKVEGAGSTTCYTPRRRKEEGAGGTTSYIPEEA